MERLKLSLFGPQGSGKGTQAEMLAKKYSGQKPATKKKSAPSADVNDIEKRLRSSLGTKVALKYGKKGGTVTIYYYSDEELDSLLDKLT